ncbi:hypothetical protein C8J56DRAFT_1045225 [Mycena floridula]|nr:hypothetical protein C8J56DRAFT_1045225 [Mycena floridula]
MDQQLSKLQVGSSFPPVAAMERAFSSPSMTSPNSVLHDVLATALKASQDRVLELEKVLAAAKLQVKSEDLEVDELLERNEELKQTNIELWNRLQALEATSARDVKHEEPTIDGLSLAEAVRDAKFVQAPIGHDVFADRSHGPKNTNTELIAESARWQEELTASQKKREEVQSQIDGLNAELEIAKAQTEASGDIQELRKKLKEQRDSKREFRERCAALETQVAETSAENDIHSSELDDLRLKFTSPIYGSRLLGGSDFRESIIKVPIGDMSHD